MTSVGSIPHQKQDLVITIDGPAASGKSSVSRELAKILGWNWVSTGAFYRGLALVANRTHTDLKDEKRLASLAKANEVWTVEMLPERTSVFHERVDVTDEVNRENVGTMASTVSQYPDVRKALLESQRNCLRTSIAQGRGLVAEGRDCGTVVFPNATLKVYLTARAEDRAARRAQEEGACLQSTIDAQKVRDSQDANRQAAPMQVPSDALVIDTSEIGLLDVVEKIRARAKEVFPLLG